MPVLGGGYCVDDVARLAVVCSGLLRDDDDSPTTGQWRRVLTRALAFLVHAYDPSDGGLHNILGYDRRWADEPHDGDHLGRTVWALGAVLADHPVPEVTGAATRLLADLAPAFAASMSPRSVAYGLIGLALPERDALPDEAARLLEPLANRLAGWYEEAGRPGWPWFEPYLTYDNARLPQALLLAGRRTDSERCRRIGLQTLDWYAAQCHLDGDYVRLVGNRWRYPPAADETAPDLAGREGDEQPLDAAALTEALMVAHEITGQEHYAELARRAFAWFLGRNRLREAVYDERTGGCHDGLGRTALNDNQGAESTLAFFQAIPRTRVERCTARAS